MRLRGVVTIGTVLAASAVLAAPAFGAHHLVRISEVYPGATGSLDAEAVELQLMANGENQVANQVQIQFYDQAGNAVVGHTLITDPPNGQSQRTMLLATAQFEIEFGIQADFEVGDADELSPAGGSVCMTSVMFGSVDCVGWGSAVQPSMTSPIGTPAAVIPDNNSLVRTIARGCATALDGADDTNDSAADFAASAPTLRNNAATPTETLCTGDPPPKDTDPPETRITKGPKGTIEKDTAKFRFESDEPGSTFECKAPGKAFKKCSSPKKLKNLDEGRQKFKVRAIDKAGNVDTSPAKRKFKVDAE